MKDRLNSEVVAKDQATRSVVQSSTEPAASTIQPPIVPLWQMDGIFYLISPTGELRRFRGEALEQGRGVRAMLSGTGNESAEWLLKNFSLNAAEWPKQVGTWIIERCNEQGYFNPDLADIRDIGIWRLEDKAVLNDGASLFFPGRGLEPLSHRKQDKIWRAGSVIEAPSDEHPRNEEIKELVSLFQVLWGWKNGQDHRAFLGWLAAAVLGGYPKWRPHILINAPRGSGKSELLEMVERILGGLAGQVLNDVTEPGLRQSRNNQARPLLIDEFEPGSSISDTETHQRLFGLFRRMSGGNGGQTVRGSAGHKPVSFRTMGAVAIAAINAIEMSPQDRTRFINIELGSLPLLDDPLQGSKNLERLKRLCSEIQPMIVRRMLDHSLRWDETHRIYSAEAHRHGADRRQADTAAAVLTGFDLLCHDAIVSSERVEKARPLLDRLLRNAEADTADSEGAACLDHLLSYVLTLDHGVRRNVFELIEAAAGAGGAELIDRPEAALARIGVFLREDKQLAIRTGSQQIGVVFNGTKWTGGAHRTAMMTLPGAELPSSAMRLGSNRRHRVLLLPLSTAGLDKN